MQEEEKTGMESEDRLTDAQEDKPGAGIDDKSDNSSDNEPKLVSEIETETENAAEASDDKSDDSAKNELKEDSLSVTREKIKLKPIDSAFTKLLPFSVIAALLGAIIGPIPLLAYIFIGNKILFPLFAVAPLLTHLLNKLFRGGRDVRTLIINIVFSFASAFMALIACQAVSDVIVDKAAISQIPRYFYFLFGTGNALPTTISGYTYPLIFTVLGIAMSWELMRGSRMVRRTVIEVPFVIEEDDEESDSEEVEVEGLDADELIGEEDGDEAGDESDDDGTDNEIDNETDRDETDESNDYESDDETVEEQNIGMEEENKPKTHGLDD